jgi:hypothetical protein
MFEADTSKASPAVKVKLAQARAAHGEAKRAYAAIKAEHDRYRRGFNEGGGGYNPHTDALRAAGNKVLTTGSLAYPTASELTAMESGGGSSRQQSQGSGQPRGRGGSGGGGSAHAGT